MRATRSVLVAIGCLLTAAHASAAENGWTHVEGIVGLGTPVGFGGVAAGYAFFKSVELGGDIGLNASGPMGGPYLRLRSAAARPPKVLPMRGLTLDLALSAGELEYKPKFQFRPVPTYHSDLAWWLQFDVAYEVIDKDGFTFRAGLGFAFLLNPGRLECAPAYAEDELPCEEGDLVLPMLVAGLGHVF